MKKNNLILSAALAAVFSTSAVFAEAEVTGKIVHESAKFTESGTSIGATTAHGKDNFKQETSAKIYIDGEVDEINEGATYHVELNLMTDGKAIDNYDSSESYTQRDALREAYVDSVAGDWSLRTGKQQVVWGTADGMKLLDMINPTDYSEMAQNQMEDSRIPVWMVNAETTNEDGSEFQVVVSQPRENVFAGMNRNINTGIRANAANGQDLTITGHDQGQPFMMKGVDTIIGKTNGFINGVPDLGSIAGGFAGAFINPGVVNNLTNAAAFTVSGFAQSANATLMSAGAAGGLGGGAALNFGTINPLNPATFTGGVNLGMIAGSLGTVAAGQPGSTPAINFVAALMSGADGSAILNSFARPYDFNLTDATSLAGWSSLANPNSMFEYMDRTSFATFNAFVSASSQYAYDMPSDTDVDVAFRLKDTTIDGVNFSTNYSYNYDKNPIIDLSWHDPATGEKLVVNKAAVAGVDTTVISLTGSKGVYGTTAANGNATLRFTETLKRAHNLGGSFDTAIETEALGPVVIRGEGLYQKDVYSPVFNRGLLAVGDLVNALKMTKGDRFKYVLGADVTALTNMMISAQFIQDRNLDYVDNNLDWDGSSCTAADGVNCGTYTADFATMHMGNGFNKAEKNKEFYSLFFSKPFGASGEHRWNNITMYEENGGKWNRADAEFSIDDDTQATIEYNKYWGDENTQFGQLEASSNIQVGVKYSF